VKKLESRFLALTLLIGLLSSHPSTAADRFWACGNGLWDSTCWSAVMGGAATLGQPQNGDNAFLYNSGATNVTVNYANTLYPSAVLGTLYVNATGSGTMALSQTKDSLASFDETIGSTGTGSYSQSGGMNTVYYNLNLGFSAGSTGSYFLSGTGSLSANTEIIGNSGSGGFTQNGGTNSVTGNGLYLGYASGSSGTYNLSGGSLAASDELVGDSGSGAFTQSGGMHTVTNHLILGIFSGSNGSYTLSDTGNLSASYEDIGYFGTGTFTQTGGTNTLNYGNLSLGYQFGGNGTYNMSGGSLSGVYEDVGFSGTGIFIHSSGTNTITNELSLGFSNGSNGSYTLGGSGGLSTGSEIIGIYGTGTFTQNGGTNTVTNSLYLDYINQGSGTYNLNGGKLTATNIIVNSKGQFNFNGGKLAVGHFSGNLINNGGTLAPGNSPGTTTITGNYTQSALGTYEVEVGGLLAGTEHDVLNISGTATLGGTLNVSLIDLGSGLFTPHLGDSFDILTAETLSGSFSFLTLAALDPGLRWDIGYLTDAIGTTDVVRLQVAAVPIPSAVWLFGTGLLGLVGMTRRRARDSRRT
jgi:hypothetical protein